MNSLEIVEFESKIIELLNTAALPMEVKRLIVSDVLKKVEQASNQEVNRIIEEDKNSKKESETHE